MPEGDTVRRTADRLHRALAGSVLTGSDLRVPAFATSDLSGQRVVESTARGKHLLLRLAGGLTLHTHLRMEGSWHLYRSGSRWSGGPAWQVRVVLATAGWQAVGYRLPVVELLPTAEEGRVVGHLGPDLLGPDWDEAEALRRLTATPDRQIGDALLDQRNLAGIGNMYKAEALFLTGVSPWTSVGAVRDLVDVVRLARRLLQAGHRTGYQVQTGDPRRGFEHWLYGRAGRPCRRCGTPIALVDQGEPPYARGAYWCPSCQPGPPPPTAPTARSTAGSGT